ncbi:MULTISPECIES: XRE family transcriptional regulator [unclassified Niallia]|uniref:helix-turn-helix domain-containing protein n=1 Tax=unclassified Niallia TaxID=2837522 RepID=UPI001EDB5528|nr:MULTISPECIES: XRE family transcriptional regulator [unclassified Niallia]MDL0435631.1 XRE family transcriptional regulator [Niallia sp. SS-2023]UPO88067.1 XRE family transcriptional regulator [Niallia sp. Man26]
MESITNVIGQNLENLRKTRGYSLDKAAELTGVSKAMLAQIEKGKSNPTVSTLWKIAMGLQVSFSYFMTENTTTVKKVLFKEIEPFRDDANQYRLFSLFPFHPEKKFEVYTVEMDGKTEHFSEKHAGEEYVIVGEGSVAVVIGDDKYYLEKGDALSFTSNRDHLYINTGDTLATLFVLIYYPE